MILRSLSYSFLLWLLVGCVPATTNASDVIVVCPPAFRASLEKWVTLRQSEKLSVTVIPSEATSTRLATSISSHADRDTRYVVLIGDAPVIGTGCNPDKEIPTSYQPTTVSAAYGSTPTLATDVSYGDFDGDQQIDAAVGRLPVHSVEELNRLVDRIVTHDTRPDFGAWRGDVQLVGGIGGFGMMIDAAIESVTRTILTSVLPPETRTLVAYASPGHQFFPREKTFTQSVLNRYQRGARFWVYAGHGHIRELDRVPRRPDGIPVLDCESVSRLQCPSHGAPIALMLACFTGAIDAPQECLAERMLLCDGGPIAVLAGSRMTMPYGNATCALSMIDEVYQKKQHRLGDAWRETLRAMQRESVADPSPVQVMIDSLATLISPAGTSLVDERREHTQLYQLLGDPLLHLHPPSQARVGVAPGHENGEPIDVEIYSPLEGELTVSIHYPLGKAVDSSSTSPTNIDPNDTMIASLTTNIQVNETVTQRFMLPSRIEGPLVIRAIISSDEGWATGAAKTQIRRSYAKRGSVKSGFDR